MSMAHRAKLMMPFTDPKTDFDFFGLFWFVSGSQSVRVMVGDTYELGLLSVWCITTYKVRLVTTSRGNAC